MEDCEERLFDWDLSHGLALIDLVFEDFRVGEVFDFREVFCVAIKSVARDEADDLHAVDLNAEKVRLLTYRIVRDVHSGYFVIDQVH